MELKTCEYVSMVAKGKTNGANAFLSGRRVLVVDDECAIADLVGDIFASEGIEADVFYSPYDALSAMGKREYSLAVIDIMMPGMDGFELCVALRGISDIPIVFLSAKDQESDVVAGLTLGADDYIVKPFKPRELIARVKAHLRRHSMLSAKSAQPSDECVYRIGGIELNPKAHTATLHDVALQLTPKEFDILRVLMDRAGEPVSAKEIYEAVWEERADSCSPNTIMVHIRHLRHKLSQIDSSQTFIETAWGVGYRMAV